MTWRTSSYSQANGSCIETASWRKSSYSHANGNCVECAAFRSSTFCAKTECIEAGSWRTSSHSTYHGSCVSLGRGEAVIGVRDTKDNGQGPVLEFTPAAWIRFTGEIRLDLVPKP